MLALAGIGTVSPRARAIATVTARRTTTADIALRYASDERTSEIGAHVSAARLPAAAAAVGPPSVPMSAASADAIRRTVGASAVMAIRASRTIPSSSDTTAVEVMLTPASKLESTSGNSAGRHAVIKRMTEPAGRVFRESTWRNNAE